MYFWAKVKFLRIPKRLNVFVFFHYLLLTNGMRELGVGRNTNRNLRCCAPIIINIVMLF
jgi:hypothetical protein